MSRDFPGRRLYGALERTLDPSIVQSVVAPTFGDLHFEVQRAGTNRWHRGLAYLRCYLALSRVFIFGIFGHVLWRFSMRRLMTIVVLGALGAASLSGMMSTTITGPIGLLPFLGMAIAAPVVLRFFKLGRTYREMFINCVSIAAVMVLPLLTYVPELVRADIPWGVVVRALALFAASLVFASALLAAAAWRPSGARSPLYRRSLLTLLTGGCVFALASGAMRLTLWRGFDLISLLSSLAQAAYMGFVFALVAALVHLPIVLAVRRALNGPRSLAVVGAVVSPLPMFALFSLGQGSSFLARLSPAVFIMVVTPYILAGAAMGWSLAGRSERQVAATEV